MPASAGRSVERIYYTVQRGRKTPRCAAVSANDGGNALEIIERFSRTDAYERLAYPYKTSSRIKGVTGAYEAMGWTGKVPRGAYADHRSDLRGARRALSPADRRTQAHRSRPLRLYDVPRCAQQHLSPGSRGVPPSAAPDSGAARLGSAYSHRGVCHRDRSSLAPTPTLSAASCSSTACPWPSPLLCGSACSAATARSRSPSS